jgi:hypothetical protein
LTVAQILDPRELEAKYSGQRSYAASSLIMFSMSYEYIVTIIFVAVQVVKKEVIGHRRKSLPKQSSDGAPSTWIALGWVARLSISFPPTLNLIAFADAQG